MTFTQMGSCRRRQRPGQRPRMYQRASMLPQTGVLSESDDPALLLLPSLLYFRDHEVAKDMNMSREAILSYFGGEIGDDDSLLISMLCVVWSLWGGSDYVDP
jgi:hypothetical protein